MDSTARTWSLRGFEHGSELVIHYVLQLLAQVYGSTGLYGVSSIKISSGNGFVVDPLEGFATLGRLAPLGGAGNC